MISYECINGLRIKYPESLARFVERVSETEGFSQALSLVFSEKNPIMRPSPIVGAEVTKETISNPVYRVLKDILERKRLSERCVDISKLAAGYTLTVAEAAERLGAHESTVRKAIREGRLACWVKDGVHYLSPKWTDQFKLATEKSRG